MNLQETFQILAMDVSNGNGRVNAVIIINWSPKSLDLGVYRITQKLTYNGFCRPAKKFCIDNGIARIAL